MCIKRLPINANVLCHMIELLCAAYAVGHCLRIRGSLHDVTLSRRLISRLYADEQLRYQNPAAMEQLVELLPILLWELYYGSSSRCPGFPSYGMLLTVQVDFLLYDGSSRFDHQFRNILVARMLVHVLFIVHLYGLTFLLTAARASLSVSNITHSFFVRS